MSRASNAVLRDRGHMLSAVRSFFEKREVLEVDCPLLSHAAPIDAHIDLFEVDLQNSQKGYLHSSPEYGMKRLLSQGIGSIYQLSHVYRKGEAGQKHNPEFTLIEWYRPGFSFKQFLEEMRQLVELFLGDLTQEVLTYREAFQTFANIDIQEISLPSLREKAAQEGFHSDSQELLLNFLWGTLVEPHLGKGKLTTITDYPADQAALAQTRVVDGEEVAERFEIYFEGMELGNGFHELTDPIEQERRLHTSNAQRTKLGKETLPIDRHFLKALEVGLPDAYGMAIGFDRLMMLRHKVDEISAVLPFSWKES